VCVSSCLYLPGAREEEKERSSAKERARACMTEAQSKLAILKGKK